MMISSASVPGLEDVDGGAEALRDGGERVPRLDDVRHRGRRGGRRSGSDRRHGGGCGRRHRRRARRRAERRCGRRRGLRRGRVESGARRGRRHRHDRGVGVVVSIEPSRHGGHHRATGEEQGCTGPERERQGRRATRATGHAVPCRRGSEQQTRRDEAVPDGHASGHRAPGAGHVRQVSGAASVRGCQTELRLLPPVDGDGGRLRMTSVRVIDAVDRRAAIAHEPEERTHAIHDVEHSNAPPPGSGGTTDMKIPATTYFPRRLPPKYLRRWRA
jgi:hypothetical protein